MRELLLRGRNAFAADCPRLPFLAIQRLQEEVRQLCLHRFRVADLLPSTQVWFSLWPRLVSLCLQVLVQQFRVVGLQLFRAADFQLFRVGLPPVCLSPACRSLGLVGHCPWSWILSASSASPMPTLSSGSTSLLAVTGISRGRGL